MCTTPKTPLPPGSQPPIHVAPCQGCGEPTWGEGGESYDDSDWQCEACFEGNEAPRQRRPPLTYAVGVWTPVGLEVL